jgi:hypothetical protein
MLHNVPSTSEAIQVGYAEGIAKFHVMISAVHACTITTLSRAGDTTRAEHKAKLRRARGPPGPHTPGPHDSPGPGPSAGLVVAAVGARYSAQQRVCVRGGGDKGSTCRGEGGGTPRRVGVGVLGG